MHIIVYSDFLKQPWIILGKRLKTLIPYVNIIIDKGAAGNGQPIRELSHKSDHALTGAVTFCVIYVGYQDCHYDSENH